MKYLRGRRGLVTKPGMISLALLLALGAGFPIAAGCASDQAGSVDAEYIGSLGLELEVAPGVTLLSVSYSITGNGFTKTGSIDVGNSPVISGTIGGIPAGSGYLIELSATSVEDATSFTGSANFDVTADETTSVSILLSSAGENNTGNVAINGTIGVGPVISELTATPVEVFVGGQVTLSGVATDPVEGPSPLSYSWSSTGGVLGNPLAANATLSSDTPGTFTVQLSVSDGELTATQSVDVHFVQREGGGTAPEHPNVLLIIADDLGAEATSLYPHLAGNSGQVPIPNIEALAENGLVFENAWASPMCSPTRSTIISGLYGYRTGVTTAGNTLSTSTTTVFDRITAESSAAYGEAFFGKYHLSGNNGATNLQHVRDLGIPVFRGYLGHTLSPPYNWTAVDINGPSVVIPQWAGTALTDFTIDYINNHESTRPSDPWFVWLAHNASHESSNYAPPPQLHSVNLGNLQQGQLSNTVPNYKAIIQSLDTELGRLLAEVDLTKTTVIFIGDNGTPSGVKDSGSRVRGSKTSVYQGGVHVPLIIAGAGVTRRGREDALVTSTDLYATILSLAGLPVSQVNNSYSLTPLLTDENATTGRTHSFTELSTGATGNRRYAVRDQRYKLIYNVGTRELYDLVNDPLEATNLFNNSAYAEVRASLEAEVATHRAIAPTYFP